MKWWIIPDIGGYVLLPRLVLEDVMKQLIYTAEPVTATQAQACGLVTTVDDDPLSAAQDLVQKIAQKAPNAIRAAKRLCKLSRSSLPTDMLMAEAETQAKLLGQPEQMEVVAAQFAGRAPVFK